jgi:hypothetical protein
MVMNHEHVLRLYVQRDPTWFEGLDDFPYDKVRAACTCGRYTVDYDEGIDLTTVSASAVRHHTSQHTEPWPDWITGPIGPICEVNLDASLDAFCDHSSCLDIFQAENLVGLWVR